ncbi:MAG: class I SAM-dependent methyltransferase [Pseudomonadales bacterium]|nr:class I SAM-dependent methyltransferase [Pseudomonadales bacterium]
MSAESLIARNFASAEIPQQLSSKQFLAALPELTAAAEESCDYCLSYTNGALSLDALKDKALTGVCSNFLTPAMQRRLRQPFKQQLLGKALGLKAQRKQRILDATAGLGTDAFLMAASGCEVTAIERSPLVFALLEDALLRAQLTGGSFAVIASRLTLQQGDFLSLDARQHQYDTVYLDPMFPAGRRKASAKKAMTLLQQLLPAEDCPEQLLSHGLKCADKRVVVKRGRRSPPLAAREPSLQCKGSTNRFDVYLP